MSFCPAPVQPDEHLMTATTLVLDISFFLTLCTAAADDNNHPMTMPVEHVS